MNSTGTNVGEGATLGASAKSALFWSIGFTLFRDLVQLATMLILVRVLVPGDYGRMALAQSVHGIVYVLSFATFAAHALQLRDPRHVDWQAHFVAGAAINGVLFLLVLGLAYAISGNERFSAAAMPLAVLSTVYLVDIPATLRQRMLEAHHEFKRSRTLLMIGSVLAMGTGLAIALAGGGVLALAVQPALLLLPAAVDLFRDPTWRAEWSWSWARYRETAAFGANRIGPAGMFYSRQFVEQALMAATYSLAMLGHYSRAIGLATLLCGRVGQIVASTLYPVLTRAERRSAHFKRNAGLLMQGVAWTTIPGAAILALASGEIVELLYGAQWFEVVPLLPLAAAAVSLIGINHAAYNLLLANDEQVLCLRLDILAAVLGLGVAFLLIRQGAGVYLAGLSLHGLVMLACSVTALIATEGADRGVVTDAFVPALVATALAWCAVALLGGGIAGISWFVVRAVAVVTIFGVVYVSVLRFLFPRQMATLVDVAPGSVRVKRALRLA